MNKIIYMIDLECYNLIAVLQRIKSGSTVSYINKRFKYNEFAAGINFKLFCYNKVVFSVADFEITSFT